MSIFFVSGIDTDAGKTYVTGALLKYLLDNGIKAITFKLIQTGSDDNRSIDIDAHRRIAGMAETDLDKAGLTHPQVFTYPASPHLAAELDKREIDFVAIEDALNRVEKEYDVVLVEGAGGLMVPLTRELLTVDYAAEKGWPLILVTSGKLGSINHTLLSLEAAASRDMKIAGVIYNDYPEIDRIIEDDAKIYMKDYIAKHYPGCAWCRTPVYRENGFDGELDFSAIFKLG